MGAVVRADMKPTGASAPHYEPLVQEFSLGSLNLPPLNFSIAKHMTLEVTATAASTGQSFPVVLPSVALFRSRRVHMNTHTTSAATRCQSSMHGEFEPDTRGCHLLYRLHSLCFALRPGATAGQWELDSSRGAGGCSSPSVDWNPAQYHNVRSCVALFVQTTLCMGAAHWLCICVHVCVGVCVCVRVLFFTLTSQLPVDTNVASLGSADFGDVSVMVRSTYDPFITAMALTGGRCVNWRCAYPPPLSNGLPHVPHSSFDSLDFGMDNGTSFITGIVLLVVGAIVCVHPCLTAAKLRRMYREWTTPPFQKGDLAMTGIAPGGTNDGYSDSDSDVPYTGDYNSDAEEFEFDEAQFVQSPPE